MAAEVSCAKVIYKVAPRVTDAELNTLFAAAWAAYEVRAFGRVLERALSYICAYDENRLIGFVNVAWDGGVHGFILDTTVHPDYRRRGIGARLVEKAVKVAKARGLTWLHVDYEAGLEPFYTERGFHPTEAGLMNLKEVAGGL